MMKNSDQNINQLIIIGNGFDLDQNLKTRYSDFVCSTEFKSLINSGNFLASYLEKEYKPQLWFDVENKLKEYSNNQNAVEEINFEQDFMALSDALKNYLNNLTYDNLDETAYSFKLLKAIQNENFLILDFNYTRTTEIILLKLGLEKQKIDERLIKVHGSVDDPEVIFGTEDDAIIKPKHIFLKKSYNPHFKAIDINQNLENIQNIYIFGHSLGETDHMYFKNFFQTFSMSNSFDNQKTIVLFYCDREGYNQLHIQLDRLTNYNLTAFKQNNRFIPRNTLKRNSKLTH